MVPCWAWKFLAAATLKNRLQRRLGSPRASLERTYDAAPCFRGSTSPVRQSLAIKIIHSRSDARVHLLYQKSHISKRDATC